MICTNWKAYLNLFSNVLKLASTRLVRTCVAIGPRDGRKCGLIFGTAANVVALAEEVWVFKLVYVALVLTI